VTDPAPVLLHLLERRTGLRLAGQAAQVLEEFRELERDLRLSSAELLERLADDSALLERLATRFTVPETYFFRVTPQMEALRRVILPSLMSLESRRLRCWSAGCSTGEEVYTLAILLAETLPVADWNLGVLGTDLNPDSLQTAQAATYGAWSFRDTPPELRLRHFETDGVRWKPRPELRQMTAFRELNLLEADWGLTERFELILCRNVTIYFAASTAQRVYERLAARLQPGGWLVLGPSDPPPSKTTLDHARLQAHFENGAILYQKTQPTKAAPSAANPRPAQRQAEPSPPKPRVTLRPVVDSVDPRAAPAPDSPAPESPVLESAEAWLQTGLAQLEANQPDAALVALRRAVYLEPRSPLAQFALARAFQSVGEPRRARAALRQARRGLAATGTGSASDEATELGLGFTVLDLRRALEALSVMLGAA
jgi:chemotaxis protein methyltransferase CheR